MGTQRSCIPISTGALLLLTSCGDPVAPARITGAAFEYETQLSKSTMSLSDPTDSLVVFIRVRNPLPVTVTSYDPWWNSDSDGFEWEVDIWPQFETGYSGYVHSFDSNAERLTLEAGATIEAVIVLDHHSFRPYVAGKHYIAAGTQSSRSKRHAITLTP